MLQSAKLSHRQKNNMNLRKKSLFPIERESLLQTQIYFTLDHISNHPTPAISIFFIGTLDAGP